MYNLEKFRKFIDLKHAFMIKNIFMSYITHEHQLYIKLLIKYVL